MNKEPRKPILSIQELVEYYQKRECKPNPSLDSLGKKIEWDVVNEFSISLPSGSMPQDVLSVIVRDKNGENPKNKMIDCTEMKSQLDAFIYLTYFYGNRELLRYDRKEYCCEVGSSRIRIEQSFIRNSFADVLNEVASKCNRIHVNVSFTRQKAPGVKK